LTGDRRESRSMNYNSQRLRIYCFTFVAPQSLSGDEVASRAGKMIPMQEVEWGRVPHLHSQFKKCDGHGIYSNETYEAHNVQGIDPAIAGIPLSGAQLRYTGSASTYLAIWGSIIKTPALRDGFDWYVMLDSDSYVQPDRVRDILSDSKFDTGLWQVGRQQEWAVNAAMLSEMANQWSWLNDRYKTGRNAGCPKWLLDDSGEHYVQGRSMPFIHCAQDEMQRNMPSALNKHLPAAASVQVGDPAKWKKDARDLCEGGDQYLDDDVIETCALSSFAKDCEANTGITHFCDTAIIHGVKTGTVLSGFQSLRSDAS